MIRAISSVLLAAVLFIGAPALAQPVGTFAVAGQDYTGTVTVTQTGQTFNVAWTIGPQRFRGIGIFVNGVLSVGYSGEGATGIALYRESSPGVWEGPWALVNEQQTHTERWTRQGAGATPPAGGGNAPPAAGATPPAGGAAPPAAGGTPPAAGGAPAK